MDKLCTLNELIKNPFHKYPTKFSVNCFSLKAISLRFTKYSISFRGPKIWNKFLTEEEKELQSFSILKNLESPYLEVPISELKIFCHYHH